MTPEVRTEPFRTASGSDSEGKIAKPTEFGFERPPDLAAADRGFASATNEEAALARGVRRVVLPRPGRKRTRDRTDRRRPRGQGATFPISPVAYPAFFSRRGSEVSDGARWRESLYVRSDSIPYRCSERFQILDESPLVPRE